MRKLLLATTALFGGVAFASAAHAAAPSAPITLNVGGYVDAVAGFYHEAGSVSPGSISFGGASGDVGPVANHDFETEFKINFDAMGKASNGMEYGANVSLWNGPEATNLWTGGGQGVSVNSAYVWLSGTFGKAMFGDSHGASDLFVYAPTVGEGQTDGRYMDFVSPFTLARVYASGIDNTEHGTNITFFTPKVGNDDHKVQLGLTYEPNMYDYGSNVIKDRGITTIPPFNSNLTNGASSPYRDVVKGAVQYTGNWHPVSVVASAQLEMGGGHANGGGVIPMFFNAPNDQFHDFTSWGVGAQATYMGVTLGGSYDDMGHYGTVTGQGKDQQVFSFGGKYEFDKVSVAANWLNGEMYDNMLASQLTLANSSQNYVSAFNAESIGATYTWFPGFTTNGDFVLFQQDDRSQIDHNDGYVALISQKMTF